MEKTISYGIQADTEAFMPQFVQALERYRTITQRAHGEHARNVAMYKGKELRPAADPR
jgi:hypothetical protein